MASYPNCEIPPNRATVIAFEFALLNAQGIRQRIAAEAMEKHGVPVPVVIQQLLAGDFEYGIAKALRTDDRVRADPTLLTLIAMDAHARFAEWLRDGAEFHPQWTEMVSAVTHGNAGRVILRADSRRRDVIPFLERWHLHDLFAMIRCADDPPIATSQYRSTLCRSWEAIIDRFTRWGIDQSAVTLLEGDPSRMVAMQLLSGGHISEFDD